MVKVPDASAFPARAPLQGRGGVPAADGAAGGMMQAANLFGRAAQEQAVGTQELGRELGRASEIMLAAEIRGQERRDSVGRAKAVSILNLEGAEEHRRLSVEGDWSDPKTLRSYHEFLNKRSRELIGEYGGSPDSQAQLTTRIEGLRAGLADAASASHFEAGRKLVTDTLTNSLNELHAKVQASPADLMSAMATFDAQLADMRASLPPDEERALKQLGDETLTTGAFEGMFELQQIDAIEKILLETPGIRNMIGPANQRQISSRIFNIRREMAEARKPIVVGGSLVEPDGKGGVRVLYSDPGEPVVVGDSLVTRGGKVLYKGEGEKDKPFGAGKEGGILQMLAEKAPMFGGGLLTPVEDRLFLAAIADYTQQRQVQNPDTQQWELITPKVPEYVNQALALRGYRLSDGSASSMVGAPREPAKGEGVAAEFPDPQEYFSAGGTTLAELVVEQNVTGPEAAVARTAAAIPYLGIEAPEEISAKARFELTVRRVVNAVRVNPRFAEGEREDIQAILNLAPSFWDNPQALISRMVGIDQALRDTELELEAAVSNERDRVPGETAKQALSSLHTIRHFRKVFLPPIAMTDEEAITMAQTFPPGSTILRKKGKEWVLSRIKGGGEKAK